MQLDHLSAADRSDGKLPGGRRRWRSAGRAARACMLVTGRAGPGRHRPGLEVAKAKGWVVDLDRLPAPISARRSPAGRKSTRVCAMTCLESGWIAARARAAVFFAFAAASSIGHRGIRPDAVHPSARERELQGSMLVPVTCCHAARCDIIANARAAVRTCGTRPATKTF